MFCLNYSEDALQKNMELEFTRNKERFQFLKVENMLIMFINHLLFTNGKSDLKCNIFIS